MQASSGKLYGMTNNGGISDMGVLFEYDYTTNTFTKKFDFTGSNGKYPFGSLMQASNGNFYGMTSAGGAFSSGVLFEYNSSYVTDTVRLDFGGSCGSNPHGDLTEAPGGKLYGMTPSGGPAYGTLFHINLAGFVGTLDFNFSAPATGQEPFGSLELATDGNFYGMTRLGGLYNSGIFFQYNISTGLTKKFDFNGAASTTGVISAGGGSYGTPMQASNGKIYGLTYGGGGFLVAGALYEYDISTSALTPKLNFAGAEGGPLGSLTQASNGKVYGVTSGNGTNKTGMLFQYDRATNTIVDKYDCIYSDGAEPHSTMVQASNGKLYGIAALGGANGYGTIFEFDPNTEVYVKKLDLTGTVDGWNHESSMVEASNGKLYGVTYSGGANNYGVIYEYDPVSNIYTKKFDFDKIVSGAFGYGALVQASNNKLYGMNSLGGANNSGVLYEYDPLTNIFVVKLDLNGVTGTAPYGALIMARNGKLYGLTRYGGTFGMGTLFEYDFTSSVFTKKIDFDGVTTGQVPGGSLLQASNGKLYGMTAGGGVNNEGTVFEYDIPTNSLVKKLDMNYANGSGQAYNNLIEYVEPADVWPGDSNQDSVVDNNDLLQIGLWYSDIGSARSIINNNWQADSAANWGSLEMNGSDIKHADCNGDGIIDNNDTLAINLNFSLTHTFAPPVNDGRSANPNLYFATTSGTYPPGSWINVDVMAGTSAQPVTNLYGVAFNINYNSSLVQPGTESLIYPNCWLANPGTDAIKIGKVDAPGSTAYAAETRIDHVNRDGYGKIASFRFQAKTSISSASTMNFSFSGYSANDSLGTNLLFSPQTYSVVVDPLAAAVSEEGNTSSINIYPNPYSSSTQITYTLNSKSEVSVEVFDIIGNKVEVFVNATQSAGEYKYRFSAKEKGFGAGVYFVKITIDGKEITKKIVEMK